MAYTPNSWTTGDTITEAKLDRLEAAVADASSVADAAQGGLAGKANTAHTHPAADLPAASTTTAGVVELATNAETTTGTDTARAVTPAGVKAALDARPPGTGITPGTAAGQIPVWDGDSYEPQTPANVTAADVPFTPAGNVAATTVQAAIAEVDAEKAPSGHTHAAQGISVQDENGTAITGVTQIDFQGAGVTAAAGTGEVVVTIPGGGGAASAPRNPNPQAQNLKGWTFDPAIASGTASVSTGIDVLYLGKILTPESISISNVLFVIGTTATTDSTGFYAAIILPDGTVVRQSADISATVNATAASSLVTAPLTSAVTVGGGGVTDFVYAAIGWDSATTSPNIAGQAGSATQNAMVNAGLTTSARRHGTISNTTWPLGSTVNLASQTQAATPKQLWMAVS